MSRLQKASQKILWGKKMKPEKLMALGTFGLVMAKYSLKMKKILQDKPMSTMINTCYK